MNINVTVSDDETIYCNVQLITPVVNIGMIGIKGDTGSIPASGIPVSNGTDWVDSITASAASDFIVAGASPFAWVKKTLAQVKTILGLGAAAYGGYASSAEIITGTEPAKAIAPDQLRASEATAAEITTGTAVKLITADKAHTSLMKVSGSNLTIGSDADGDMYYRASSVLARLAKGTANYKMFMNAAGTAPEWANGIKNLTTTFDASTVTTTSSIVVTGVGFKPSAMIVIGNMGGENGFFIGEYGGGVNKCMIAYPVTVGAHLTYSISNNIGTIYIDASNYQFLTFTSFDSDGVTLSNSKGGTITGTLTLLFFFIR